MNGEQAVVALLGVAAAVAAVGWLRRVPTTARTAVTAVATVLVSAAALVSAATAGPDIAAAAWVAGLMAAVLGGYAATVTVFALVDSAQKHNRTAGPKQGNRAGIGAAGSVLRGGAWIGALERAAVYAVLTAGSVEGMAVVVAVKTLARYPELAAMRHGEDVEAQHDVAERFIIGTFTSVLWAAGCAGTIHLLVAA